MSTILAADLGKTLLEDTEASKIDILDSIKPLDKPKSGENSISATMSLIDYVSWTASMENGRECLPLNRPTLLLACLCFVRLYTLWNFHEIGLMLQLNFPDLLGSYDRESLREFVWWLWEYTQMTRPDWLRGMHLLSSGEIAWPILFMLQRQEFRCSCMFPTGWTEGQEAEVDLWRYLLGLMNLR